MTSKLSNRLALFATLLLSALLLTASAGADTVISITTASELETLLGNGGGGAPDGAVIELAAGTYMAPTGGFLIFNPDRNLTVRAAAAGGVFLDGGGNERILRYIVNNDSLRGSVTFEGLTFRHGYSTGPAFGAAVTMENADATFIDCLFRDNVNESAGAGSGTVGLRQESLAYFLRTTLQDNTSQTSGGAMAVLTGSTLWCQECTFLRNRNNVAGHTTTATGGGFVATGGSQVYLANSRFEDNEAGFAGGAFDIKGLFTDASPVELYAANTTFTGNLAEANPGVSTSSAPVGGVANIEDNAIGRFYNSRFIENVAARGGALAVYRAQLEIFDSVFEGNYGTGNASVSSPPRGGAIFAISDDTGADGANNRPNAEVLIRDSLFDGTVPGGAGQSTAAQSGGCVYTTGDIARFLGQGISQAGTQTQNSAVLDVARTAFFNCDVSDIIITGPFGGAVFTALADVTIADSLFTGGDSTGTNGAGGALAMLRYSDATVSGSTFSDNSSPGRGGAIFTLGSDIDIDGCTFFGNSVPGDTAATSRGAAIFAGPFDNGGLDITGVVRNSLFAANDGLPIFDDDRVNSAGVFNFVTYQANEFFPTAFAPSVLRNPVGGTVDVAGLDSLVVDRGSGNTTDKAPVNDNVALGTQPIMGELIAVPPATINAVAVGDAGSETESYLAWAWDGSCAELDGGNLAQTSGLSTDTSGVHSLMVFDNGGCSGGPDLDLTATITQGPTPAGSLSADPIMITGGGSADLDWARTAGTPIQAGLNQGLGLLTGSSGTETVSPALTSTYTLFVITEEGGTAVQETVYVDEEPPATDVIFEDGFESGNTTAWSTTIP